jgi:hypothetical protein
VFATCVPLDGINVFSGHRLLKTAKTSYSKTMFGAQVGDDFHLTQADVFA